MAPGSIKDSGAIFDLTPLKQAFLGHVPVLELINYPPGGGYTAARRSVIKRT